MDSQKIDLFIAVNSDKLHESQASDLYERLQSMDDSKWQSLVSMHFKSPTFALLLSFFFGVIGVDRFYIGTIGLGVLKLLTLGGLGLWTLIDLFTIMGITRDLNYEKALKRIQ